MRVADHMLRSMQPKLCHVLVSKATQGGCPDTPHFLSLPPSGFLPSDCRTRRRPHLSSFSASGPMRPISSSSMLSAPTPDSAASPPLPPPCALLSTDASDTSTLRRSCPCRSFATAGPTWSGALRTSLPSLSPTTSFARAFAACGGTCERWGWEPC
eukprot:360528-Chlamydomonas_euryale.AAC.2